MWHMLEQYPESRLGRLCKVILLLILVYHSCYFCCCCLYLLCLVVPVQGDSCFSCFALALLFSLLLPLQVASCCSCCCTKYGENTSDHHWGLSFRRSPTVRSVPFARITLLRIMSKCSDPKLSFQPVLGWFFLAETMITEQVLLWPFAPLVQHCAQFLPDGKTPCDWRDSCANFQGRPWLLGYNLTISGLHTISDASFAFRLVTKVHYMLCYVGQYSSLICVWVPYLFLLSGMPEHLMESCCGEKVKTGRLIRLILCNWISDDVHWHTGFRLNCTNLKHWAVLNWRMLPKLGIISNEIQIAESTPWLREQNSKKI